MAVKKVRDLAGSEKLDLILSGDNTNGWSLTQTLPPKTPLYAHGTATASGNGTAIPAAGAGVSIVIDAVIAHNMSSGTAVIMKFNNGTAAGSVLFHDYAPNQGDGIAMSFPSDARPRTDANTPVIINLSANVNVPYTLIYHTESLVG